jgi:hypothetical protein
MGLWLGRCCFDTGGELAKQFADAWFEKTDAFMKEGLSNKENN